MDEITLNLVKDIDFHWQSQLAMKLITSSAQDEKLINTRRKKNTRFNVARPSNLGLHPRGVKSTIRKEQLHEYNTTDFLSPHPHPLISLIYLLPRDYICRVL